jgi:hypothetical protein
MLTARKMAPFVDRGFRLLLAGDLPVVRPRRGLIVGLSDLVGHGENRNGSIGRKATWSEIIGRGYGKKSAE